MGYGIVAIIALACGIVLGYFVYHEKRKKLDDALIDCHRKKESLKELHSRLDKKEESLEAWKRKLEAAANTVITLVELQEENVGLKQDLKNIDVERKKLKYDRDLQKQKQEEIDNKVNELGRRYLDDNVKWIGSKLTVNNFVNSKERFLKVVSLCRNIGFVTDDDYEKKLLEELKAQYEKVVRADFEKQEQARIKAQIREEQKLEREVQKELDRLDREREAIQIALEKALREADDKYSEEVERLKERLREAEERSERAVSQAQLTKSGHVYVISNIGSFGDQVYKIGMTRRLEPEVRIKELSSASVPFPYDVHMMISSDDAPSLENALHKSLHKNRLNKINLRKEFFKADIDSIKKVVEEHRGEIAYVADAEALEYYQSINMSDEDYEYIEQMYDSLEDEEDVDADVDA